MSKLNVTKLKTDTCVRCGVDIFTLNTTIIQVGPVKLCRKCLTDAIHRAKIKTKGQLIDDVNYNRHNEALIKKGVSLIYTEDNNNIKENDKKLKAMFEKISKRFILGSKDFSETSLDAYLYGIFVGWDDKSYDELQEKFNWNNYFITHIKTMNKVVESYTQPSDLLVSDLTNFQKYTSLFKVGAITKLRKLSNGRHIAVSRTTDQFAIFYTVDGFTWDNILIRPMPNETDDVCVGIVDNIVTYYIIPTHDNPINKIICGTINTETVNPHMYASIYDIEASLSGINIKDFTDSINNRIVELNMPICNNQITEHSDVKEARLARIKHTAKVLRDNSYYGIPRRIGSTRLPIKSRKLSGVDFTNISVNGILREHVHVDIVVDEYDDNIVVRFNRIMNNHSDCTEIGFRSFNVGETYTCLVNPINQFIEYYLIPHTGVTDRILYGRVNINVVVDELADECEFICCKGYKTDSGDVKIYPDAIYIYDKPSYDRLMTALTKCNISVSHEYMNKIVSTENVSTDESNDQPTKPEEINTPDVTEGVVKSEVLCRVNLCQAVIEIAKQQYPDYTIVTFTRINKDGSSIEIAHREVYDKQTDIDYTLMFNTKYLTSIRYYVVPATKNGPIYSGVIDVNSVEGDLSDKSEIEIVHGRLEIYKKQSPFILIQSNTNQLITALSMN